jgi:hypothetical protein
VNATFRGRVRLLVGPNDVLGRADLTSADGDGPWHGDITVDQPELFAPGTDIQISIGRRTAPAQVVGIVPGCDGNTLRIDGVGAAPF